jgi:hypothetical protein
MVAMDSFEENPFWRCALGRLADFGASPLLINAGLTGEVNAEADAATMASAKLRLKTVGAMIKKYLLSRQNHRFRCIWFRYVLLF